MRQSAPGYALIISGLAGTLIGFAFGARHWSSAWPELSQAAALRGAALGWLAGILLSPFLAWGIYRLLPAKPTVAPGGGKRLLYLALLILALAPLGLWANVSRPESLSRRPPTDLRPNIILISIDALRADHVGAYGSEAGLTPNLDAFAKTATRYEAAFAAAPWTLPSFGALFTGRPPSQCGLRGPKAENNAWYTVSAALKANTPMLSEQLQKSGYITAAELSNPFLTPERGWRRGFTNYHNEGQTLNVYPECTRAETVTQHALAWLRLNRKEPFFLWVHYLDPHTPYDSPDTPAQLRAAYPSSWSTRRNEWYKKMQFADAESKARYEEFCRKMYAEEVRYADRWVGELLRQLKYRGLYESALIVITADHGEELFDHGGFEHGHGLQAELLQVPLLIKWPVGYNADREIFQTVALADLGGTLLRFAGKTQATERTCLPEQNSSRGREVYSESLLYGKEQTALTTDDYKIIYHFQDPEGRDELEVYDRRWDPLENAPLASDKVALSYAKQLIAFSAAAHANSRQAESGKGPTPGVLKLPSEVKRELRSLGYLGD